MKKVMVFIDFENFNIATVNYYRWMGKDAPRLDYGKIPREIVKMLRGHNELVKTFLFAPKPDDFLMRDRKRKNIYDWLNGLKNQKYFSVIEGQHIARPVSGFTKEQMDIERPQTYYVQEKGTDINMGVHIVSKGFLNAYDTAVIVSGDSDYLPILNILDTIGKIAVVVGVKDQHMQKLRNASDDLILLDEAYFNRCKRNE